ncbi:hypothetical protein BU24DRAFT_216686 [Aaosphaeria arxii CBS 175.79]|uniref:Uncharacterized protein n=1 Tax=Aaosphaeria arxii CBS 175.79 TaxID=1450172 RepID=A0A6A5XNR8_9PLEO|nr:uncharacterized protein BU24DRAFT_216686 [Aaosphaeria arxii CBS 175.79]KAF2014583.1 hypothetical protein BU24DRAFT_216686 [Aaosphaeria arxii CBS 175.79]
MMSIAMVETDEIAIATNKCSATGSSRTMYLASFNSNASFSVREAICSTQFPHILTHQSLDHRDVEVISNFLHDRRTPDVRPKLYKLPILFDRPVSSPATASVVLRWLKLWLHLVFRRTDRVCGGLDSGTRLHGTVRNLEGLPSECDISVLPCQTIIAQRFPRMRYVQFS